MMESADIFISYTGVDLPIAKAVKHIIGKFFKGKIKTYLADDDSKPGVDWKKGIIENLHLHKALIIILSESAMRKPWIFIEWSHFWVSEKPFFPIIIDSDVIGSLKEQISPILDRNYLLLERELGLNERSKLISFFEMIAEVQNIEVPYENIDWAIHQLEKAFDQVSDIRYATYANVDKRLPLSDFQKLKVLNYFVVKKDIDTIVRIIRSLEDDSVRSDAIRSTLKGSALLRDEMHEIYFKIYDVFRSDRYIRYILNDLINNNESTIDLFDILLNHLKKNSQGTILSLIKDNYSEETTELLNRLTEYINNNDILVKLLDFLIDKNDTESSYFEHALDNCNNAANLRRLLERLIREERYNSEVFEDIIDHMNNDSEICKALIEVIERRITDFNLTDRIINIHSSAAANQRKILLKCYKSDMISSREYDLIVAKMFKRNSNLILELQENLSRYPLLIDAVKNTIHSYEN